MAVVPSLQDGLNILHLLVFTSSHRGSHTLPTMNLELTCVTSIVEDYIVHKGIVASALLLYPLLSYIACFGEHELPCCENTQASLWRGSCGKELRPPTNS